MAIVKIRPRRDSAADWTAVNPTLADGEIARETDTGRLKFGTGVAAWNALAYWSLPWSDVSGKPANLTAIGALVSAADRLPYFTGAGTAALAPFTAAGRALVDDADAAAQRVTLGLGTIATQGAGAVNITGGSAAGITSLEMLGPVTFGGTGPDPTIQKKAFGYGGAGGYQTLVLGGQASTAVALFDLSGIAGGTFDGNGKELAVPDGFSMITPTAGGTDFYRYMISVTAGVLSLGAGDARRFTVTTSAFVPYADNVYDLGSPSKRFAVVYAGTGTINTSDARAKRDIGEIPDAWLDAWADVQWSRFRFKDGERWHTGLVAQQVRDAFKRHGLDACEIGLLCYDKWPAVRAVRARHDRKGRLIQPAQPGTPAGDRWGLRMDECDAIEHALNRRERARQQAEIDDLRKLVTALGGGAR